MFVVLFLSTSVIVPPVTLEILSDRTGTIATWVNHYYNSRFAYIKKIEKNCFQVINATTTGLSSQTVALPMMAAQYYVRVSRPMHATGPPQGELFRICFRNTKIDHFKPNKQTNN